MKTRLSYLWEQLRSSYWFIPTAMVVAAVVLSTASVALDRAAAQAWTHARWWLYRGGPAEASTLLSTIAGSMATVVGVTFSITIVTLSLASSQFGPRLLRSFMRDTGTQVVLGTFVATFVYSVVVLQSISAVEGGVFVPRTAVAVGIFLAVASLFVLIYFIHHISTSIQAGNVIAAIGVDLDRAIDFLFSDEDRVLSGEPRGGDEGEWPGELDQPGRPVPATQTGYLQAIDRDELMRLATERDLVLRLRYRPGDFIVEESDLVIVWPAEETDEEMMGRVNDCFILGAHRIRIQDVELALNQLVEIAVRALSAGINDPFTAMACIDRLGASLVHLAERQMPKAGQYDDQGRLRLIRDVVTFGGVVDAAFNQIRQNGRANVAVIIRLLEALAIIATRARTEEQRGALRRQAEMVWRGSREALPETMDLEDVEKRYRLVLTALGEG